MLLFDTLIMKSPERSRQEIFYFCSSKPGTRNPEPGTRNLEPGTWNPQNLIFHITNKIKNQRNARIILFT